MGDRARGASRLRGGVGGAAGGLGAAGRHRGVPTGRRPGSPTRRRRSARFPSGQAQLREAFHACRRRPGAARRSGPAAGHGPRRARGDRGRVRPGRGAGPARCPGRDRRARARHGRTPRTALTAPGTTWTPRRPPEPRPRPSDAAEDLARLAVADAARREWAEAHAGDAEAARAAEAELRRRDQAERIPAPPGADHWPMTDAEFSAYLDQLVAAEAQPDARPGSRDRAGPRSPGGGRAVAGYAGCRVRPVP